MGEGVPEPAQERVRRVKGGARLFWITFCQLTLTIDNDVQVKDNSVLLILSAPLADRSLFFRGQ